MEVGRRGRREMSPERGGGGGGGGGRIMRPTFKKVQVVYYLSRNGHLQHPHYMEVTHLVHQPLRLKDVMDRLTMLRGKGMPSLYSWSIKRSYKNGYVWNDLAPNDVIYPSEGAEYVLKGSELIEGITEKLCHVQIDNGGQHSSLLQPKRNSLASKQRLAESEEMLNDRYVPGHGRDEGEEEEEEEYEEKTSCASSTTRSTPRSRRSRGVSTDDLEEFKLQPKGANGGDPHPFSSPPSATSPTFSGKANAAGVPKASGDDAGSEPLTCRNSMLLSLIACGGSASFRKAAPPPPVEVARKSGGGGGLNKKVVRKAAEEDEAMIVTMSENPRFGNVQAEEKEYFSGSIVEDIAMQRIHEGGVLKKSSSHNEERSGKKGLAEVADEEEEEVEKKRGVKGKCIPMKKSPYKHPKK